MFFACSETQFLQLDLWIHECGQFGELLTCGVTDAYESNKKCTLEKDFYESDIISQKAFSKVVTSSYSGINKAMVKYTMFRGLEPKVDSVEKVETKTERVSIDT